MQIYTKLDYYNHWL